MQARFAQNVLGGLAYLGVIAIHQVPQVEAALQGRGPVNEVGGGSDPRGSALLDVHKNIFKSFEFPFSRLISMCDHAVYCMRSI